MLKKTITYKDFNDVEHTEDFFFNLTKSELMEMEMSTKGGLAEAIEKSVSSKDSKSIIKIFKDLILKSYGEKDPTGKFFNKSEEISNRFANSIPYDILFMELVTDSDAAVKFFTGIIPANLDLQIAPKN